MKHTDSQSHGHDWVADIADELIPILLEQHAVPGLALATVVHGQIAALRGYGYCDRAAQQPMHAETILNVASLSKPVTTWGVLRLVEQYSLDLDVPIRSWLHRWEPPRSDFDPAGMSIRRLLSHTAGLSMPSVPWFPLNAALPTLIQVLRGEAGDHGAVVLERAPGSVWAYSGGGYAVLELLIEEISGQPFAEYLHTAVFKPLGMQHSTFALPPPMLHQWRGYDATGALIEPYQLVGVAAGGLFTTVADLAHMLIAYHSAEGVSAGRGVISPAMLALMSSPVAAVNLADIPTIEATAGLGHFVHTLKDGTRMVYHSGGNPGVRAYLILQITCGLGLVLIANSDNGVPLIGALVQRWGTDHALDVPPLF